MICSIVKNELKKQLKDKGFFFWLLGMPVLFIVLFSFVFANDTEVTFSVNYIDDDQTQTSQQLLTIIDDAESFELVEQTNLEEAVLDVNEGNIASLIYIPKNFEAEMNGADNEIDVYYDSLKMDSVQPILNLVENISFSYEKEKVSMTIEQYIPDEAERTSFLAPPFSINQLEQQSESVNAITQIVPGYTVMFTFFIIISMVMTFVKDREHGMLARLASTPMNKFQYLIGKWIPFVFIVFTQIWVLLGFGYVVYGLYLGNLFSVLVLSLALTLATTSLGLAISLFAKSENFGIAITQVIALGGAMLGGLWMPIEFMPAFMQKIALFIPQYWAQQGFQDIMLRGAGVSDILNSILFLLAVAVIGLLLAALLFKRFLQGAKS